MFINNSLKNLPAMARNPAPAPSIETAFLEEMLKYCGPKASEGGFSGGAGKSQFASFLQREYAVALGESLDLGLDRALAGES